MSSGASSRKFGSTPGIADLALHRYSDQAETDLRDIALYTAATWGDLQAGRYVDDLDHFCSRLAALPSLGRACDFIQHNLRRAEHGRHVIFYRRTAQGIRVLRILHQRMLPNARRFLA